MTERIKDLINSKQYTMLRQELLEMNVVDIAAFLDELEHEECFKIFRLLPKDIAADVFAYFDIDLLLSILTKICF